MVSMNVGCGGWHGHGDIYRAHSPCVGQVQDEATYRVGQPGSDWIPKTVKGMQVYWVHARLPAAIRIHSRCDEHGDSSLEQFTDHLRIDWTSWTVRSRTHERLLGRDALRTVVDGSLDGIEMKLELLVVKKNGCLFDLSYIARPEAFDSVRSAFGRVVSGFDFPVEEA